MKYTEYLKKNSILFDKSFHNLIKGLIVVMIPAIIILFVIGIFAVAMIDINPWLPFPFVIAILPISWLWMSYLDYKEKKKKTLKK